MFALITLYLFMQPKLGIFLIEGFDETCAFKYLQERTACRPRKFECLPLSFCLAARGLDELNETQIRFGTFGNANCDCIVDAKCISKL
ncbi:hypothetical protein BBJ66_13575 [Rhizobium sp. RSm-3]|nr:hypothetical protein BBJ66_13575 [Rhizobium sp. RSm-3]